MRTLFTSKTSLKVTTVTDIGSSTDVESLFRGNGGKPKHPVVFVACFGLAIAWSTRTGLAADQVNYSGRYSLQKMIGNSPAGDRRWTLDVKQNPDSIEITRSEKFKTHSVCPLNGSEGNYTTRSGLSGKCKAQLVGDTLVVEWRSTTTPAILPPDSGSSNLPSNDRHSHRVQVQHATPMHGEERWQLSEDSKTLTISTDNYVTGHGGSLLMKETETYIRTENR